MVEANQGDGVMRNFQYGVWREGTEKPGYSSELINVRDQHINDWDSVFTNTYEPREGINTIMKAF